MDTNWPQQVKPLACR